MGRTGLRTTRGLRRPAVGQGLGVLWLPSHALGEGTSGLSDCPATSCVCEAYLSGKLQGHPEQIPILQETDLKRGHRAWSWQSQGPELGLPGSKTPFILLPSPHLAAGALGGPPRNTFPPPHGASLPTLTCLSAQVQPPKKSLFSEMGHASKPGHRPHPPSSHDPSGSSGRCRNPKGPRPFKSFLDFLVEGQVLESLQTVVEEATERMATVKTEAGVPLVEVQDPVEMPRGRRRARARPSLSTLRRHRARPGLCVGRPNNYPSRSSSMSDSHSSCTAANWPGCHSRDSDLGSRGLGRLPPVSDQLLLEKSLRRLLQLESRGVRSGAADPVRGCGADPRREPSTRPCLAARGRL